MTPQDFIDRWRDSGGAELANSQSFLKELCALLDVPQPEPAKPDRSQNTYVFEKAVEFNNGDGTTSAGRVDLYRTGCFVLESKQGAERKAAEQAQALATKTKTKKFHAGTAKRGTPGWEHAMVKARQQAKRYAEALPDEWPPFLVVVDVGYCFDLYADFTQSGKNYVPFPAPDAATKERIRPLGEPLDAHRKRQQELFPDLTMTGMYNVLEKLRAAERYDDPPRPSNAAGETGDGLGGPSYELTAKEREIHEKGLVSVLKQIHDDLDAAVFDAYGWPHDLDDEQILQRLVDLNHQRAAEEARGHIRWLRPEFQNPDGQHQTQTQLDIGETEQEQKPVKPTAAKAKKQKQAWPSSLPERVSAVRTALADHAAAATPAEIAKYFSRARKTVVEELLDTLVTVGQARQTDDGKYVL